MSKSSFSDSFQIPIDGLNVIFEAIFQGNKLVFWMVSSDNKKQLYVSDAFCEIWGVPTENLYERPEVFTDFVLKDDLEQYRQAFTQNMSITPASPFNHYQYRIINQDGKMRQICDCFFPIYNFRGEKVAIAGLACDVTENKIDIISGAEVHKFFNAHANSVFQEINSALDHLKLSATTNEPSSSKIIANENYMVDGQIIRLSPRQADCINLSLDGLTAKEIAKMLSVSPRTVEEHITILKDKFSCKNKLQLIHKFAKLITQD